MTWGLLGGFLGLSWSLLGAPAASRTSKSDVQSLCDANLNSQLAFGAPIIPVTNPNSKVEPLNLRHTSVDPKGYDERWPTAEAYKLHTEPQPHLVVMIIFSIITLVTCKELIMKGVRRQRLTGCMTMMMMMMERFILTRCVL